MTNDAEQPVLARWSRVLDEKAVGLTVVLDGGKRLNVPWVHLAHIFSVAKDIRLTFSCAEIAMQCIGDYPMAALLDDLASQRVTEIHSDKDNVRISACLIAGEEKIPV